MWYVSAQIMFVTGQWYLLFLLEPICQTQSIVELRFSSVKIKQLHLLLVSTSKRNPRRMQLSQRFEIGFWLILDYRFPDFCFSVFPGFVLSGLRFTLHLTLQGRLNRRFIRGCSSEISIETCLVDSFLILEQTLTSDSCFTELFSSKRDTFSPVWSFGFFSMG